MRSSDLFSRLYDPFMEVPENLGLRQLRWEDLRGVRGRVLELGIGTGRNLPLYLATVERVTGIDPDEGMLDQVDERARKVPFPVGSILASAEDFFEENSFDAVEATLVFCTIPDPARALREVRWALKPDGSFYLLEHEKMNQKSVAWVQEKSTLLWNHIAGSGHLDRDTLGAIRDAGFKVGWVEPHLRGLFLKMFIRSPSPVWLRLPCGCAGRL